jgi:hypothetical protein
MSTIPTAEEFLQDHHQISHFYDDKTNNMVCFSDDVQKAMIEFAKLHVKKALKEASESRCVKMLEKTWYEYSLEPGTKILARINIAVNKDSILNSYPLTNIK